MSSIRQEALAIGRLELPAFLSLPPAPRGVVVFVHGSGSSRLSPRNLGVAAQLNAQGLATLLFDLLSDAEAAVRRKVFDIALLAGRVHDAVLRLRGHAASAALPLGLFGASTGAAAALCEAAAHPARVAAVVSRGGRPDLAGAALESVRAPTLLIVGGVDHEVLALNQCALARLNCPRQLDIVPGATHLFDEAGALDRVAQLAAAWFLKHLASPPAP